MNILPALQSEAAEAHDCANIALGRREGLMSAMQIMVRVAGLLPAAQQAVAVRLLEAVQDEAEAAAKSCQAAYEAWVGAVKLAEAAAHPLLPVPPVMDVFKQDGGC